MSLRPSSATTPEPTRVSEILSLVPRNIRTERAFSLPHNDLRRCPPKSYFTPETREDTPSRSTSPIDNDKLVISFLQPPKDVTKGYTLGSSDTCDIIIGKRNEGVSGLHLIISFDQHEKLLMKDVSSHGSHVSYDEQPLYFRASPFTWVLPAEYKVTVEIGHSIKFDVQTFSPPPKFRRQYQGQILKFLDAARSALPSINNLNFMTSAPTTVIATPQSTSKPSLSLPAYVVGPKLGSGGFGRVFKVYNASDWKTYARKEVIQPDKTITQEVATLKMLSHDNIIRYIDVYQLNGETLLVMELCASGSLVDEAARSPFQISETCSMLKQLSSALEHIHGFKIVHRDIKPANILIKFRDPLHVVLADFGLAKAHQRTFASTVCGTDLYLAPEVSLVDIDDDYGNVHKQSPVYWEAVDIWGLGVVGLEYSHGLPKIPRRDRSAISHAMTQEATRLLTDLPDNAFVQLVSKMLQQDPWDRPAAQECSQALETIYIYTDTDDLGGVEPGAVSPTQILTSLASKIIK